MIKSVRFKNSATYPKDVDTVLNLKKVNFIYGANGSGKSTIANILGGFDTVNTVENCVEWDKSNKRTLLVYTKKYIEQVLGETSPGIYTFGDNNTAESEIETKAAKKKDLENVLNTCRISLDKEMGKQKKSKSDFIKRAWTIFTKHKNTFDYVFTGYKQNKQKFAEKVLEHKITGNIVSNIEDLNNDYKSAYVKNQEKYDEFQICDTDSIEELESNKILKKTIVGKSGSQFSDQISKLNNSDWVKRGLDFCQNLDEKCPFCQQVLSTQIINEIKNFFDKQYEEDIQKLNNFAKSYDEVSEQLKKTIQNIIGKNFLDIDKGGLQNKYDLLTERIQKNIKIIKEKIQNPSNSLSIDSISDLVSEINNTILSFNKKIKTHNDIIDDLKNANIKVSNEVWSFVRNELEDDIKKHQNDIGELNRATDNLNSKIKETKENIQQIESEIKQLKEKLTSVEPSVAKINNILRKYQFDSFYLRVCENDKTKYEIVRENGNIATDTLSEGERTFISFLYFYYQIQGSVNPDDTGDPKIVTIDDPISSLDSNVLHIVSSLVKDIIGKVDDKKVNSDVEQIVILTHNVYFYHEVVLKNGRERTDNNTNYFIVRKSNGISRIKDYDKNIIKTSYSLLWDEIKNAKNSDNNEQNATLYNTMRRILEHYFKLVGSIDYDKKIKELENSGKLKEGEAKVLIALSTAINDGSHNITDDIDFSFNLSTNEQILNVFEQMFTVLGHKTHYNMMMGITGEEDDNES